jgi:two-component system, chemotaxis family, response regulator Rcp1
LECSNAFTQPQIIQVRGWALQFASALSSELEDASGWNLNPEEVRRFSLRFQQQNQAQSSSKEALRQILLVEDNPADVELVMEALEEHAVSCELLLATNGERAITFLDEISAGKQSCPDLLILDLNLPRKSGKDILERMRAGGICQHVPVVVLTSSDSQTDKDAVARFQPSRYIRKPLELEDFLQLGGVFKRLLNPAFAKIESVNSRTGSRSEANGS